jgi:ATP-dependent RNA helicase DBP3
MSKLDTVGLIVDTRFLIMSDDEERRAKKAKKAEKKRKAAEQAAVAEAMTAVERDVGEIDASSDAAATKKSKKDKKHKDVAPEVEAPVEESEEEVRRRKKAEKKARKAAEGGAADVPAVAAAVDDEDAETEANKSKKSKKDKKKESTGSDLVLSTSSSSSSSSSGKSGFRLYLEHDAVKGMSEASVKAFRDEAAIQVYPEEDANTFKPLTSLQYIDPSLANYCPHVKAYIAAKKFTKPSPIQAQCWPPLLEGRDVIGIAATGSGKVGGPMIFPVPYTLYCSYGHSSNNPRSIRPPTTPSIDIDFLSAGHAQARKGWPAASAINAKPACSNHGTYP